MSIRRTLKKLPLLLSISLFFCFLLTNRVYADDISFRFDSDKTAGAFTSTWEEGGRAEIGMLTKKGTLYSSNDLQGIWYLSALTSPLPYWQRGTLVISGTSFTLTGTSSEGTANGSGSVTIDSDGVITVTPAGLPVCIGHLDSGKTIAACTQTNGSNSTMMVFVKKSDSSYAQLDGLGTWHLNSFPTGDAAPYWERGIVSVAANGSFESIATDYFGDPEVFSSAFVIAPDGTITIVGDTESTLCYLDAGKTFIVCTQSWNGENSTAFMILTKKADSYSTADTLNGIWYINGLTAPSALWERGIVTFGSGGTYIIDAPRSDGDTNYARGTMSITTDGTVTMIVSCDNSPVRRNSTDYFTIQAGCNSATADGQTVQVQGIELTENPILQNIYAINLQGGYDCEYTSPSVWSTITGSLTLRGEAMTVDRIVVK